MSQSFRWYLAGPMSGYPGFNLPAFEKATAKLRARGMDIVSPVELDTAEYRAACLASPDGKEYPPGDGWGDLLSRDVKIVADEVGGIVLLPGWQKSRGARLEVLVGLATDKVFALWLEDYGFFTIPRSLVRADLVRNIH